MSSATITDTTAMLDAALAYQRLGMAVYAPAEGSKLPGKDTSGKAGLTSATALTDPEQLRAVYAERPANNVAMRLDACTPNLCVLDLDTQAAHPHTPPDPDGVDVLHEWCDANGVDMPDTWALRTASGGVHLVFRLPKGEGLPKSRDNLLPHVDFLGAGHGEILPPSRIARDAARREPYRWIAGNSPWDVECAELPRPLYDLWRASSSDTDKPKGRNESLASLCGKWWGTTAQTEDELVAQALDYNEKLPDPLPDSEVRKVAHSIAGRHKNRKKQPTQGELVEFMRKDEKLRAGFGTNTLDGGLYVMGPLPWDEGGERRRWQDADTEHLFVYMQEQTKTWSRRNVAGAFTIVAAENRFNPIADMLDELPEWDGTARADYLLWALFGCEDTEYTRAVSHTFMRGAVLRGYQPGCKFDSVLTLIGPQGCGKTLGTRRMAMRDEFLCESVSDLTDLKLTAEQTANKWLCELGELEGMTGRRLTGVKQAITMQSITVRLAYERHPVDLPRSCVFVATTNESSFLADRTGARRFWPIRCAVDQDRNGWASASDRDLAAFIALAWAEVVHEYRDATKRAKDADEFRELYPTILPADVEQVANAMRDAASVEDTRVGVVREWLESVRIREGVTRVCARMVAERALGVDMGRQRGHQLTTDMAYILDQCPDWESIGKQRVAGYGTCRAWEYHPTE